MKNRPNQKYHCTAFYSKEKIPESRVCDFSYLTALFESELSDHAKYIFCKYFSDSGFRHGWLLSFRIASISNDEFLSLKILAEKKFIELREEMNGFISIGRTIWPESCHRSELSGKTCDA